MKTISWSIDGRIGNYIIHDEFMYNDSENELMNITRFCEEMIDCIKNNTGLENLTETDIDIVNWLEIAISAYVTGAIETEQYWGNLALLRN